MVYIGLLWRKYGLLEKESVSKDCSRIILPSWKTELDKQKQHLIIFWDFLQQGLFFRTGTALFHHAGLFILFF